MSRSLPAALVILLFACVPARADLVASDEANPRFVPPPAWFQPGANQKTALFSVTYNVGCPPTNTNNWPGEALTAFQYAVDIWASILNGSQTIVVNACWRNNMSASLLGSAGPSDSMRDFAGAPVAGTWYHIALANQLANADLNAGVTEIWADFNANQNWYFGTDGNPGMNQYDFVTVAMHELGHGLGMGGSMDVDNGVAPDECDGISGHGCWGGGTVYPFIYDRLTERGDGTPLLSVPINSAELGTALTTGVWFNGIAATGVYGFLIPLNTPGVFSGSASYSHVSDTFDNTPNSLMTWSLGFAEAVHHPGPIVIAMLDDEGWDTYWLGSVYVSSSYVGPENGTIAFPFNSLREGSFAVHEGGTVYIQPGVYNETLTIARPMELRVVSSPVTIGQ